MSIQPDNNYERDYYEDEFNWNKLKLNSWIQQKIDVIKSIIPPDVKTIADIGCGNGIITHTLGQQYRIIGLDRSRQALHRFRFQKINGDITNIPIRSNSIDLVISSEVLEHLPGKNLDYAVKELMRISRKYILVTVPNQENLKKNNVKCSACGNRFNVSMHFNSFNLKKLATIFSAYRLIQSFEVGKPVRQYNNFLLSVRQNIANVWGRFAEERRVTCPECGTKFLVKPRGNLLSLACDGVNRMLSRPKPYWLGVLLERK